MDGKRFEHDVEAYLKEQGLRVSRPVQRKQADVGDIWVEHDVVLQAKAWQNTATALREGTRDADVQAIQARRPIGAAVIKKSRGSIADAYVAMPLHVFVELIKSRPAPGMCCG